MKWVLLFLVMFLIGAVYFTFSPSAVPPPVKNKQEDANSFPLKLESSTFGEVWESNSFEHSFVLVNTSDTIQKVKLTGNSTCTVSVSVKPNEFEIPPGGTVNAVALLDLKSDCNATAAKAEYDYDAKFEATIGLKRQIFKLSGHVKRTLIPSKNRIEFGRLTISQPFPQKTITIKPTLPVSYLLAQSQNGDYNCQLTPPPNESGDWTLVLTPRASAAGSKNNSKVFVRAVLSDGKELSPIRIEVASEFLGDIQPGSTAGSLGVVNLASVANETISLRSATNRPFQIISVTSDFPANFSPPKEDVLSPVHSIPFALTIEKAGQQKFLVKCVVRDSANSTSEILIPYRYYGITQPVLIEGKP